jgi:hypothetical protein
MGTAFIKSCKDHTLQHSLLLSASAVFTCINFLLETLSDKWQEDFEIQQSNKGNTT